MKIGVVCEGPTDLIAIVKFLTKSLEDSGHEATFIGLQPASDETRPVAGWGQIERWFSKLDPLDRVARFFQGGLFENELDSYACDALFIQMDSDHIDEGSFKNYLNEKYGIEYNVTDDPVQNGEIVTRILLCWSKLDTLTQADADRHVFCPSVQSTETWCIAAFKNFMTDPETIAGQDLIDEFMSALHLSESRPERKYSDIDKDVRRRDRFCESIKDGAPRTERQCHHYSEGLRQIRALY